MMTDEHKIKFLIVDDSMIVREGLKNTINYLGYGTVVGEAVNGQEAIEFINIHQVDLIIMDIKMPGLNGVMATRSILSKHPEINIFILTSFTEEEFVHDLLDAGAKGYGLKDIGLEEFDIAIKMIMNGNTYLAKEIQEKIQTVYLSSKKCNIILTKNELALIKYLQKGYTTKKIAEISCRDRKTIDNIRSKLLKKTGTTNSVELVSFAMLNNLI